MIRKLNNKGMTAIEILVTFVIVAVIVVSLYDGIVGLKEQETLSSYQLSMSTFKNLLTKDIQDDFIKNGLVGADISPLSDKTGYRVIFTLKDGSQRELDVVQQFGCEDVDASICAAKGIPTTRSDNFLIKYGPVGNVTEYELPNLGRETITCSDGNSHTIDALRINQVDVSSANQVFSLHITFSHPDFGTTYSIDIVSPISYP